MLRRIWVCAGNALVSVLVACTGEVGGQGSGGSGGTGPYLDSGVQLPSGGSGGTGGSGGVGGAPDAGDDSGDAGVEPIDAGTDAATLPPVPCVCDGSVAPTALCKAECNLAFEALFHQAQFPSFYLTIFDDNGGGGASSWQNVMQNCTKDEANSASPPPECDHQLATFHAEYDPDPSDGVAESIVTPEIEVGVHRKGRASWDDGKPSLKVKFTEFGGERFLGLTRLTLNNVKQDPSMLRERMTYSVFRSAGVSAPLANNAKLYIRQSASGEYEFYGVYANIQTLDRRFVEYHYDEMNDRVGNLFDTYNNVYFTEFDRSSCREQAGTAAGAQEARFELETNENICLGLEQTPCTATALCTWNGGTCVTSVADLSALIDSVFKPGCTNDGNPLCLTSPENRCCCPTHWDQSQFFEEVSARADTTQLLRVFAVQAIVADWDGFAGARNNFKLYHDLVSDRFVMFPWGTDQTLGYQDSTYYANWWYEVDHTESHRTRTLFMLRCEDDPDDCWPKYMAEVDATNAMFGDLSDELTLDVDGWEAQIEDAVMADTRKDAFYDFDRFRNNVGAVRHYVANRAECIAQQRSGGSCATLSCPGGMGDCNATTSY